MRTILLSSGRTGSELVCFSLMTAGYPVESEVLHPDSSCCRKYFYENAFNRPDDVKIAFIDRVMADVVLCKLLHYQVNENIVKHLSEKYRIVRLVRDYFDIYISYKIGEILQKWHTKRGEGKILPDEKARLDRQEVFEYIDHYITEEKLYAKYSSRDYTYDYVINSWPVFIRTFLIDMGLTPRVVRQAYVKNGHDPEDFFINYKELKAEYIQSDRGLVYTQRHGV